MKISRRHLLKTGYALLVSPAASGLLSLATGYNPIVLSVTLVLLTTSLVLIAVGHILEPSEFSELRLESEAQVLLSEFVRRPEVVSIDVISAGVSSRKSFILDILTHVRKPTRVLFQDPDFAISKAERTTTVKAICDLAAEIGESNWVASNIQFKTYKEPAALRLVLCRDSELRPLCAVVGWYTYREHIITGSRYPSLVCLAPRSAIISFATGEFDRKWKEAKVLQLDWSARELGMNATAKK